MELVRINAVLALALVVLLKTITASNSSNAVLSYKIDSAKTVVLRLESSDSNIHDIVRSVNPTIPIDPACPDKCKCSNDGLVNCSRLGLTTIPSLPLNVTMLDVSGNSITRFPDNVFSRYPDLGNIDLSDNSLNDESITSNTFRGTKKLEVLDISYNPLTIIPSYLPQEIATLYLFYCKIQNLTSLNASYAKLSYLDLSQNNIQFLPSDISLFFPSLKDFEVSFNAIQSIPNSTFKIMLLLTEASSLETINLRFNKLTKVPSFFPPSLLNLDLVGNPIKEILPNTFSYLSQLETLSMWESALVAIRDYAFNGLGHVTILDFDQCHVMTPITNMTFHGLTSVQTIYLSLSNISVMEPGALLGLNKLQSLWLCDNPFKTLNPLLFDHNTIPSITEIYLWGSNWNCDCKLKWLKEMQETSSVIQDPHLMVCAEPLMLKGKPWDTLHSKQFVC